LYLTSIFVFSYLLAVVFQYVFIDIFPSKIFATIGPVRFTQFAYWMIVISWTIMLSNLWFLDKLYYDFNLKKLYLFMVGVYIITGILMIDSPKMDISQKDKDIYQFIKNTPKDSVYAVCFGNFQLDIPNIAKRAVVAGNGFPFNESYLKEYMDRKELLYGNREKIDKIQGTWEGDKIAKYFRKLKPKDFIKISNKYKLDYVVIESNYSLNFNKYKPKFENKKVKIYKTSDFKEKE